MSARCNIAIKLREDDLNKELTYDDIHFLKTRHEFPYMEVYCHQSGFPESAARHFYHKAHLTDYDSVLKYILEGDRDSFDTPYTRCGQQWTDNQPYMYASLDGDIPEQYYYIFMDGQWYYKERVSANDQPMEWIPLPMPETADGEDDVDLARLDSEVRQLVERLTAGRYTTQPLTRDILLPRR